MIGALATSSLVLPALVSARLLLSLTSLPDALKFDHQLSSPLTSFLNLQEGAFLFNNGIDPYSGGIFRHHPLYLAAFSTILPMNDTALQVIWTFIDVIGAWCMVEIYRARHGVSQSPRDSLIAAAYLLNPYIFLPNLARSTASIEKALTLFAIMSACKGRSSAALLSTAFLVHLSLSSIIIIVPLLLILLTDPVSRLAAPREFPAPLKKSFPYIATFVAYFLILTLTATLASGSWSWVGKVWGAELTLPDLTPNPGLWWYFFTEMFDHFRPFFLMVFSVHLLIYIAPVCIKFQHDPLYATFILVGVLGTFKAYLTLADPGLFLSMIVLFPETFPYLANPIVTTLLHLHASLLLPLFHHLWLTTGTGNANFFYASTLVFACSNGAALMDCVWAGMRIAFGPKEGYHIVQQ